MNVSFFKKILFLLSLIFCIFSFQLIAQTNFNQNNLEVKLSSIIVRNVETEIIINIPNSELAKEFNDEEITVYLNDSLLQLKIINGKAFFKHTFTKKEELNIKIGNFDFTKEVDPIPLWLSILPPLIAIFMALVFREVFSALFIGLLVGTTIIYFYQGEVFFIALFQGLFSIVDNYILPSMNDKSHLSIIVFSMLIGGMINLITKNGGMKGVVNILSKYAKSPLMGQFITWLLGLLIFFDDYANTLVVGNTMRPVTDRLKISREKLAYIVDSTAAPVASLALITTWIGVELSYIQDGINNIGITENAYIVFINSLDSRFYLFFTLAFVLIIIFTKRDFGPMLTAEKKAREFGLDKTLKNSNQDEEIKISNNIKPRWYNAIIPVFILIFGTIISLIIIGKKAVGHEAGLMEIIAASDSFQALLWASIIATIVAIAMTISQKILSLKTTIESLINGFKTMLTALIILVLAWSLALITKDLHTSEFIAYSLSYIQLSPFLLPTLTFIFSALIAFSTGSSWGTMAILYPMILPAGWLISTEYGLDYDASMTIFYQVVSSILAGAVFGDHCSPISDTTILSSLACSCNHIEHVRTQLPYALTVGTVSIAFGTIPAAFGVSSFILFPVGIIIMYLVIKIFGKKIKGNLKS